jgi:putative HD superfamily hydrolase of NAD metabolism
MWNEEAIKEYLKHNISEKRLIHTLGVAESAVELAVLYGENVEKARYAALVHDCAKNIKDDKLIQIARAHNYKIDSICKKNAQLLHGLIGAIIAYEKMEIKDKEIFNAVRYHTTGKKNMSKLEKIIYLADYIEPSRDFSGVNNLRELAKINLDEAVLLALNNTIKFVISRGELLHIDTVHARNYLCKK